MSHRWNDNEFARTGRFRSGGELYGGYSQASRISGRPKATLSRRVVDLEESLGVRLIERGSGALRLTEAGALLHARTRKLLGELVEAGEMVSATPGHPHGRLRISAPVLLADMVLGRLAVGFARAYPEVQLDIKAEDRIADLFADGYDLVIRVNPPPHEQLVGRCVLRDERWLVAAPSISRPIAGDGDAPPVLPAIVRTMPRRGTIWRVHDGKSVSCFVPEPVMRLSSLPMLRDAVMAGAGAGLLPRSIVGHDVAAGRLVNWGVEDGPPTELWALHTSRRLASPKVTAFIKYLAVSLAGVEDFVSGGS